MGAPSCSTCRELERRVAELEELVRDQQATIQKLLERLHTNATNSGLPPSANPPGAPKPVVKKKARRRPGGQPGHPPHPRPLLPPERVTRTEHVVPHSCERCRAALPDRPGPDDPPPKRFQIIELPPIVLDVTEYQAHARTCPGCGHRTEAAVPEAIRAHGTGPNLTATLSYLTGCHGLSKRAVGEVAEAVLGVPMALGTVANLEQEVSAALAPAHAEAVEAVRAAEVKHADETGWKLRGKLCWLWAAATATAAAFVIHAGRGAAGLAAILGDEVHGVVHSDRWHVYHQIPAERRQVCWAHLKRDFQKVSGRGGTAAGIGRRGLRLVKEVFAAWHEFRAGQATREQLRARIEPLRRRLQKLLVEGFLDGPAPTASFCENLLELEDGLWTFVGTEGVEPTNNFMERLLRRAVLWRKRSFGCHSAAGCRFVERILTVVQTCRLRGRDTLAYLRDAVRAHREGLPCPSLLS